MRFESTTTSDGVGEQDVTLDGIPGVLWSPAGAGRNGVGSDFPPGSPERLPI